MYTQLEIESHLDGKLQIAYLNDEKTFNSLNKTLLSELKNERPTCLIVINQKFRI